MSKYKIIMLSVLFLGILGGCEQAATSDVQVYITNENSGNSVDLTYAQFEQIKGLDYIESIEMNSISYLNMESYQGIMDSLGNENTNFSLMCSTENIITAPNGIEFDYDVKEFTTSENGVVVSQEFLKQNSLSVGDTIELQIGETILEVSIIGLYTFEPTSDQITKLKALGKEYNYEPDLNFTDKQTIFYGSPGIENLVSELIATDKYQNQITYEAKVYTQESTDLSKLKKVIEDELGITVEIKIID